MLVEEKKKVYFRPTTPQQRRLMIKVYLETGDAKKACQEAKVGLRTFWVWYKRYREEGWDGLKEFRSRAPKNPHRISEDLSKRSIELKREHPDWGRRTIANYIRKEHSWEPVISASTVRNILVREGLLTEPAKKGDHF